MYLVCVVCAMAYLLKHVEMASIAGSDNIADKKNGNTPEEFNKEIFRIPRTLKSGDRINVKGILNAKKERFTVNLVMGQNEPDYKNIVCQIRLEFPTATNNEDQLTLSSIKDGQYIEVEKEFDLFSSFNEFSVTFFMKNNEIGASINDYVFKNDCQMDQGPDAIKYLTLGGDIDKVTELHFLFD